MAKTISGNMTNHLNQTVTTLATVWRIIRRDGVRLYLTDHDTDLIIDGYRYKSGISYSRGAIDSNVSLSVDNLDVEGIYATPKGLDKTDLQVGLYDFAEVEIAIVNWADTATEDSAFGEIKFRKGVLGEVNLSENGKYRAEIRGLKQFLSQRILDEYQPECRVDLGSSKCGIILYPDILTRNKAVTAGEHYRVATYGITGGGGGATSIITNPSFEVDSPGTYNNASPLTGWNHSTGLTSGNIDLVTSVAGLGPDDGSQFLTGSTGVSEVRGDAYQDCDPIVSGITGADIDAGNVDCVFSSRRANSDVNDKGRVRVICYDSGMSILSTELDTGEEVISPLDTWVTRSVSFTLPSGTRTIRVWFDYSRFSGFNANSEFDNVVLTVENTVGGGSGEFIEPLEDPSFENDSPGTYSTTIQPTSWTISQGSWEIATSDSILTAESGSQMIYGGYNSGDGKIYQDIVLTDSGLYTEDDLDTGRIYFYFSGYRAEGAAGDNEGRIRIQLLDENEELQSTPYDTGLEGSATLGLDTWVERTTDSFVKIPKGIRILRVLLSFKPALEVQSFSSFDNMRVIFLDTRTEVFENRIYKVTQSGTTTSTQPYYDTTVDTDTTDGTAVLRTVNSYTRNAEVATVSSKETFTITYDESRAVDDWFTQGSLTFESGANAGFSMEIKKWTQSGSQIKTFQELPFLPVPGDILRLHAGCSKRLDDDCVTKFNNAVNLQAEPFIVGFDQLLKIVR